MNNKTLALYGLKWNPFAQNVPTEALHVTPRLESFCWRVQQLASEGGFALVSGVPGCGKSAALRILSASLATQRDVSVGIISRPQASIADFYREMGELFGVELRPHNRYSGAKTLRQRWLAHIQSTLCRPVLVVDVMRRRAIRTTHKKCCPACWPSCAYSPPPSLIPTSCSPPYSPAMQDWSSDCAPMSFSRLPAEFGCAYPLNAQPRRNCKLACATRSYRPALLR